MAVLESYFQILRYKYVLHYEYYLAVKPFPGLTKSLKISKEANLQSYQDNNYIFERHYIAYAFPQAQPAPSSVL